VRGDLEHLEVKLIPACSPLLNAIAEVFGLLKCRVAREKSETSSTAISTEEIKKELVEQVQKLTKEELKKFANHVQEWMLSARRGEPVYTYDLYESSHFGDEHFTPLPDDIELILNS